RDRKQRDLSVARARRAAHLSGDRHRQERNPQGGEALSARDRAAHAPAAARTRRPASAGSDDQAPRAAQSLQDQRRDLRSAAGIVVRDVEPSPARAESLTADAAERARVARVAGSLILLVALLTGAQLWGLCRASATLPLWDEAAHGFAGIQVAEA